MSDNPNRPSFGDKPIQSAPPEGEAYSERTEDELLELREAVQRNPFGGVNYTAPPDDGYDVEGIWINFPADSRSGYATASYGLCHALERVSDKLQLVPHRGRPIDPERFPDDRKGFLDALLRGKVGLPQLLIVASAPTEAIPMGGRITVPWTTQEGDRINPTIAAQMNNPAIFQRVWAKSQFAADAFCNSGLSPERVDIVRPCLFFPDLYRGFAEQPGPRDAAYRAQQQQFPINGTIGNAGPIRDYNAKPSADSPSTFRFGYCAAWMPRKGHTDLLRAYLSTFSRGEDVVLEIKTSAMNSYTTIHDLREDIMKAVAAVKAELEEPAGGWAKMRFELGSDWTDVQMMEWVASLDCFANASYGEGTGIPQTWAMGAGVPIVTTMFGGVGETIRAVQYHVKDFDGRTTVNRVHIVPHRLVNASPDMQRVDAIWDSSVRWAQYDYEAFGEAMRNAATARRPPLDETPKPYTTLPVGKSIAFLPPDGDVRSLHAAHVVRTMYGVHSVRDELKRAIAKTTARHLVS